MGRIHPLNNASVTDAPPHLVDPAHLDGDPSVGLSDDTAGGLVWRRRRARDEVHAELASPPPPEAAVAVRGYGASCLAVGVAGPVGRAGAVRLAGLLRDLRPYSARELLLSLALLGEWHPHLVRVIGQARIQRLIDGGALELHDTPPGLAVELGLAQWVHRPPVAQP
jgi:hypothetical protein